MRKRITDTDRLRWKMLWASQQVIQLMGWSWGRYTQHKYNCGRMYLAVYLRATKGCIAGFAPNAGQMEDLRQQIGRMEENAAFWGWWKLQWYYREQDFLNQAYESLEVRNHVWDRDDAEDIYLDTNDARFLANHNTGWGKVLDESFCQELAGKLR